MVNGQTREQFHSHLTQNGYLLSEGEDTEFFSRRLRENVLYTDENQIDLFPDNNSHDATRRGPLNEKPVHPEKIQVPFCSLLSVPVPNMEQFGPFQLLN